MYGYGLMVLGVGLAVYGFWYGFSVKCCGLGFVVYSSEFMVRDL